MRPFRTNPVILLWLTCLAAGCPFFSKAQSADEVRAKFPGEQVVILNHSMNYKISLQQGQPKVLQEETQQILYLTTQAGNYMSKYGFSHSSFHELQQYEAYTRTANDKKIKVSDFTTSDSKSEGIFYDDVKETSFNFPAVAPGSVGTLHVTMLDKEPHLLSPFFFSREIPVIKSELTISCPKEMSIRYRLLGTNSGKVGVKQETRHGENIYTFSIHDFAGEKAYADAPDVRWYATHVIFYIEKYQDENGRTVRYLSDPDDLYQLDRSYLTTINKTVSPELKRIVDSLVTGQSSAEAKARAIYGWVQQHIKYVAFEQGMEGFVPRDANLVCSRRFGDCKDMSSILTVMLNTAGVPACYTWIGTRSLPYRYTETPVPLVDNHMISAIQLNGSFIFLDATDPTCVFGLPSEGIQDKEAMVAIGDSSYKIITVPVPDKETNRLTDSTLLTLTDQGLKGSVTLDLSGYYSMNAHGMLSYTQERDQKEYIKNMFARGSNKFRLDSFTIGDQGNKDHIRLAARFSLQDYARHIGDEWFLNMNLFKFYEHEEIDYPKRTMPIQFDFKYRRKYVVTLQIPEGYQVSYLPKGKSYHNAVWGFDMRYEQLGNTVVMTQEFDNDHLLLQPDQFSEWNKVLENLFPLYKETVGLAKK